MQFTDEEFRRVQRELDAGRLPTDKVAIPDPENISLVRVLHAGRHGYFVIRYKITIDGAVVRPHRSLETFDLSIPSARLIARLFHALAALNVDPWDFVDGRPVAPETSKSIEDLIAQSPDNVLRFPSQD